MDTNKKATGDRILYLLGTMNMSQRELAEKTGTSDAAISLIVSGKREPKATMISKIADVLCTDPNYLIGYEQTEEPEAAYVRTYREVLKYSDDWTKEQKLNIISKMIGGKMEWITENS